MVLDIDNIHVDTIKKPDTKGLARVNQNDHYEVTSFGHTIDLSNDMATADAIYAGCGSRNKTLYHVLNGKRLIEKEKLG